MKLSNVLRIMLLVGIIISGVSLFFDWYLFQAKDQSGNLVVYWGYNPIFNWYSIFGEGSVFNELYTPIAKPIPLTMIIVFFVSLIISMIGVVFRSPRKIFSYVLIFSILLMGFFLLIYPVFYLIPYQYYLPWISFYEPNLKLIFSYSIEGGYLLQGIGFILVFPYSIFYYKLSITMEHSSSSPQEDVNAYVKTIQEPIDFDKLIREEELKLTRNFPLNDSIIKTTKKSIKNQRSVKKA